MKQTFIIRNNQRHLLLFFAGWGMDAGGVIGGGRCRGRRADGWKLRALDGLGGLRGVLKGGARSIRIFGERTLGESVGKYAASQRRV